MSPVQQLVPDHLQPEPTTSLEHDQLSAALSVLPPAEHQRILTDLVITARRCDITRDYAPVRHLCDSIFVTARLHSSAEYRDAMQTALSAEPGEPQEPVDFLDWVKNRTFRDK